MKRQGFSIVFSVIIIASVLLGQMQLPGIAQAAPLAVPAAAWTAYNDCLVVSGFTNPANTTTYTCYSGGTKGNLKNFSTGANTSASLTITVSGSVDQQNTSPYYGSIPNSGTDAYTTFNGFANIVGGVRLGSSSSNVIVKISGLDSAKTYTFATTANRNNEEYTRNTKFVISDVANTSMTNESSSGATISTTSKANDTTVFNTGYNTVNGYVARWTGIQPGSDGDFWVTYSVNSGSYAYGPSVFMLSEETVVTPEITTTGTLSEFSAVAGSPSAEQSYTVAGTGLTANLVVTAPAPFEVTTTSGSGYASSVSLVPSGGTVPATPIYVRFNPTAVGTFSGNITNTSAGATTKNVAVSGGATANQAPVVTNPGNQSNAEGDVVSVQIAANDPDVGQTLTYSAAGLPEGLSINPATGLISGTISYDASPYSPYSVTVTASDGDLSDSEGFTWTVTNTNRAPVVTQPVDQSSAEGASPTLQISASDPDGDTLTYSASGLPADLSIDPASGLISGMVSYEAATGLPYSVTVTATDGSLNASKSFSWAITNTNRAPVVTNPGAHGNAEGDVVSVPIVASDPDGQTLTYWATGLPDGLSIDPATGVISGTVAYTAEDGSPFNVTVTASDGDLNDSESFTWTISNTNRAPEVTKPADQNSAEGASPTLSIAATDPDGDGLTYSALGLPDGLSIDPATGVISGTIGYEASAGSPFHVTVTATDDGTPAMSDSETFDWVVTNTNRAPLVTNPGSQSNAEGDVVSLQIAASDPDGDGLTYTAAGLPDDLSINPATGLISGTVSYEAFTGFPYSVTVTASDGALSDTESFEWEVVEKTKEVDLKITIDDGNTELPAGQAVEYTIVVSNLSVREVNDALVVSDLPELVKNVAWTCAASSGSSCENSSGTGDLDETVDLLAGGSATYTVTGKIGYGKLGALEVSASVTAPAPLIETNEADNTAADTTVILPALPVTGLNGLFFPLIKK